MAHILMLRVVILLAISLFFLPTVSTADEGISADRIKFAQVAALAGPASALGDGMRLGVTAAFEEANRQGGVHGRQIVLDSYDDGYEPEASVTHVTRIIEDNDHLALIAPVGTPTTAKTQPIASTASLPLIGPFTGAGFLRSPKLENVYNIRTTYFEEAEALVAHLVDRQARKKVAILYQNDIFGRVGLAGVAAALSKRGLSLTAHGTYKRNTTAVERAMIRIRKAGPDAVILVGTYRPVAKFIRLSRAMGFNPVFANISFVGSDALANALGADGDGVVISEVVPFPWDASVPVVRQYHSALAAVDPDATPGFVSLEGYLAGRLTIHALQHTPPPLTRAAFRQSLASVREYDPGGIPMTFGPADNQGMDTVFLVTVNKDGTFSPVRPEGGL